MLLVESILIGEMYMMEWGSAGTWGHVRSLTKAGYVVTEMG